MIVFTKHKKIYRLSVGPFPWKRKISNVTGRDNYYWPIRRGGGEEGRVERRGQKRGGGGG